MSSAAAATATTVVQVHSMSENRVVSFFKPPKSTNDRFIFPAEIFSHLASFKMFPEYITCSLPVELSGKIKVSEWEHWMSILIQDRKSHECGDSLACCAFSCLSILCICYPCYRSVSRQTTMDEFIEKMNSECFIPRGMFLKQQDGYVMGTPSLEGSPQCSWFAIALNAQESEKLRKEPKKISLII